MPTTRWVRTRWTPSPAGSPAKAADDELPHLLLLLGDQVYADELTDETKRAVAARRDITSGPGAQVADFEEYTWLYQESWQDPEVRWLLSTVPSAMIFDDHDVHDDWNTILAGRDIDDAPTAMVSTPLLRFMFPVALISLQRGYQ